MVCFDSWVDFKVFINIGVVEYYSMIFRMDIGFYYFYLLCYNIIIKIYVYLDYFNI